MKYPIFKVHVQADEALLEIEKVLKSGYLNEGEQVTDLTNKISEYLEHPQVVLLNSCTSALTLALKLAGVGEGDEVITTSMTCVATNTPIHNLGAKVVWCDIKSSTGNIDPKKLEALITPKTKAVICVNWAGVPCELLELWSICKKHKVKLIQDAAHAFGAVYNGKQVCHYADYTCYSFQAIKHVTSGDGGALIVNTDPLEYSRVKKLKWFGIDRDATKDEKGEWKGQRWEADIVEAGYKFHMNNITAAIGLSQLPYLNVIVDKHVQNATKYSNLFKNTIVKPLEYPSHSIPAYWVYTVILPEVINRDRVLERLNEQGVNAGLVHVPNHNYTCFKDSLVDLPETDYFHKHQLSLPCGWWLSDRDITDIFDIVIQTLYAEANRHN